MRWHRVPLVAFLAGLLVVSGTSPAVADQTVVVTQAPDGEGVPYFLTQMDCSAPLDPPTADLSLGIAETPSTIGAVSWRVEHNFGQSLVGVGVSVPNAAGLSAFELALHGAHASSTRAYVWAWPSGAPAGTVWIGSAPAGGDGSGWHTAAAHGLSFSWTEYDATGRFPTGASLAGHTIAAFDVVKGSTQGYVGIIGAGCDGLPFHFDRFRYGAPGDVTTLDFERLTPRLALGPTTRTITIGRSATLTASSPAHGATQLQAQAFGATGWSAVRALDFVGGENLTTTVTPTRRTSYRLFREAGGCCNAALSRAVVVEVRAALTVRAPKKAKRRTVAVRGAIRPAKAGVPVTVWRQKGKGRARAVRTVLSNPDGSYRTVVRFPKGGKGEGTWRLWTSVPDHSGNLGAGSPRVRVKVR